MIIKIFLLIFTLLCAQEYDVEIRVNHQSEVVSSNVFLGDIASITPLKNLEMAKALAGLVIVSGVKPGAVVEIKGSDILDKIQKAGFNMDKLGYSIPTEIKIQRSFSKIQESYLIDKIQSFIQTKSQPRRVTKVFAENLSVPTSEYDITVTDVNLFKIPNLARILVEETSFGEKFQYELEVPFESKEVKLVAFFTTALNPGEVVKEENVKLLEVDLASINGLSKADCVGREITRPVLPDTVCSNLNTQKLLLVKRKEPVEVKFKAGNLEIRMLGLALNDAAKGEKVEVKNPTSNKIIQGIVVDTGEIYVN